MPSSNLIRCYVTETATPRANGASRTDETVMGSLASGYALRGGQHPAAG